MSTSIPAANADGSHTAGASAGTIDYRTFLTLLPKAELHCHLVGTMRAATLIDLAERNGVAIPPERRECLYEYENIFDFLKSFALAYAVLQRPEDFARVAYEGIVDGVRAGNLQYREVFINVDNFLIRGMAYETAIDGIIAGLRRAEAEFGVGFAVIPAINRALDPAVAVEMVQEMIAKPRREVVGLGMDDLPADGQEAPERWAAAYDLAGGAGLKRSAHVAEIHGAPASNITIALDQLGCDRIDHGYRILDSPELIERTREARVPFTCAPHSTAVVYGFELASHPVRDMIRAGLNVTLNSDDPPMFHTDIGREFRETLPLMGFDADVAKRLCLAAVDAAWCEPTARKAMRARFVGQIAALDARLEPASG